MRFRFHHIRISKRLHILLLVLYTTSIETLLRRRERDDDDERQTLLSETTPTPTPTAWTTKSCITSIEGHFNHARFVLVESHPVRFAERLVENNRGRPLEE